MKTVCSFFIIAMVICAFFTTIAFAQDTDERLKALEEQVNKQQQIIERQQKAVDALKKDREEQAAQGAATTAGGASSQKASGLFGGSMFTNPNLSVVLDTYGYASNLGNDELEHRGIPGFTTQGLDQHKGFNLDSAELFIFSPVDPYSNLYANIPVTENGISIEEAYVVTTFLPDGWQAKLGRFKSNFSRLDGQHPHAWDFWDIALPYRAFLGTEGLGGENGVQVTYLPALPVYTQFGIEVLQGENDLLFGKDAGEGPHAFTFFVKSSIDTSDNSTIYFGPSVLFGKTKNHNIMPNEEVEADSTLYGMEAVWKWKPSGKESLTVQSECLLLTQSGNATDLTTHVIASLKRNQDGFYLQGIYRKNRWGVGARYDMLDIFQNTFKQDGVEQYFGPKPWRETASLEYNPSEFTRVRLQLTHDKSDTITGRTNDEAILQFNFTIGAHPAHAF